jgi:hypothetical protein
MDAALEKDLRALVDRQKIWDVMQRYARAVDRCDRELLRSIYWPEATEDHGGFLGTHAEFTDWVMDLSAHHVSSFHGLLNHTCDLDGDDAHCETYHICIMISETPPFLMATGRYIDHFQRRNGEWKIANRVVVLEGRFEIQDQAALSSLKLMPGQDPRWRPKQDRTDVSYHRPLRPRALTTTEAA